MAVDCIHLNSHGIKGDCKLNSRRQRSPKEKRVKPKAPLLLSCDAFHILCARGVFFLACVGLALPSKCTCTPFSDRTSTRASEHTHLVHTVFILDGRPISCSLLQPRLSLLRLCEQLPSCGWLPPTLDRAASLPCQLPVPPRPPRAVWKSHLPAPTPPGVDAVPKLFFAA